MNVHLNFSGPFSSIYSASKFRDLEGVERKADDCVTCHVSLLTASGTDFQHPHIHYSLTSDTYKYINLKIVVSLLVSILRMIAAKVKMLELMLNK